MTKAMDLKNAKSRAKAGDSPYYKQVIDYVKACPYCDGTLIPYNYENTCECGHWVVSWSKPNTWTYTPKESNELL